MRTHFWIDSWLDHGPLKLQYPRLFAFSTSPQAMISDMAGDYFNEGWHWKLFWKRGLRHTEMGQLHCLLDQIKGTHLKQNVTGGETGEKNEKTRGGENEQGVFSRKLRKITKTERTQTEEKKNQRTGDVNRGQTKTKERE